MNGALIEFFFVSVLVIGLAYGSLRFLGSKLMRRGTRLQVLEALQLGSGKSLLLLRADERELLIGVSAQSIGLVTELEAKADGDMGLREDPRSTGSFADLLERLRALRG